MLPKFIIFMFCSVCNSLNFDLCVVGATSGLGKELIYRGVQEYKYKVLALSSNSNAVVDVPYRKDSFTKEKTEEFKNDNLCLDSYWSDINKMYTYNNIVFCTGGGPFEDDYSDSIMKKLIYKLPKNCDKISLISAYGVGESVYNANVGIKIMNNFYLKDVYRAKNEQEIMLRELKGDVKKKLYRPKALSYGKTVLESLSRFDLAGEILEDICISNN